MYTRCRFCGPRLFPWRLRRERRSFHSKSPGAPPLGWAFGKLKASEQFFLIMKNRPPSSPVWARPIAADLGHRSSGRRFWRGRMKKRLRKKRACGLRFLSCATIRRMTRFSRLVFWQLHPAPDTQCLSGLIPKRARASGGAAGGTIHLECRRMGAKIGSPAVSEQGFLYYGGGIKFCHGVEAEAYFLLWIRLMNAIQILLYFLIKKSVGRNSGLSLNIFEF